MTLETIDPLGDDPAVRFPPIATRPIPAHASERMAARIRIPTGRDLRSFLVRWTIRNPPRQGRGCVQVIVSVAHSCSGPVAQVDRAAAF